ncbi:MAG: hypothetical protein WC389_20025 [Lutibacter sp.]
MIQFSNHGSRIFTGQDKGEFEFNFVNEDNVEQVEAELKKIGIELCS